jgi:uncharacterized membrane protein
LPRFPETLATASARCSGKVDLAPRSKRRGLGLISQVQRREASRHDADAIPAQEERAGDADGVGRHRVEVRLVEHIAGGADQDRDAQRKVFRPDLERP